VQPLDIAVIGTGISGMAAAWLLSQNHRVTVYEQDHRIGGHSHTIDVPVGARTMPVDTAFMVYNEPNYPNLTALLRLLEVPTRSSDMSFAVSLGDGDVEYSGTNLASLFAQKRNLLRPRFWLMLRDILRFNRDAPALLDIPDNELMTLGRFLEERNYSRSFIDEHLLPMAGAIWSAPVNMMRDHPAAEFVRFCDNHGLLQLRNRPLWRSVEGGSREYVRRLTAHYADKIRLNCGATSIQRSGDGVKVLDTRHEVSRYDQVVIAAHADQALQLLEAPTAREEAVLGAFRYQPNDAVVHRDEDLMPKRRNVWSSWNYIGGRDGAQMKDLCATYWLNRLQGLPDENPLFLTLNPVVRPKPELTLHNFNYLHPIFDIAAARAQRQLWSLQGRSRVWYCGAYFGAGFHEDGLQAGLAVAEALGGARRPWKVANPSGRIHLDPTPVFGDALAVT
jgi:predicted NAD/FAD-binding protein